MLNTILLLTCIILQLFDVTLFWHAAAVRKFSIIFMDSVFGFYSGLHNYWIARTTHKTNERIRSCVDCKNPLPLSVYAIHIDSYRVLCSLNCRLFAIEPRTSCFFFSLSISRNSMEFTSGLWWMLIVFKFLGVILWGWVTKSLLETSTFTVR